MESGVLWLLAGIVLFGIVVVADQVRRVRQARRDRRSPDVEKYVRR